jgi:hypothetical protein
LGKLRTSGIDNLDSGTLPQPTVAAQSFDLHHLADGGEAVLRRFLADQATDFAVIQLSDRAATAANQELPYVGAARIPAADECIERVEPMHQVGFDQKLECAVHRGRRCFPALPVQPLENLIRANRPMARPYELENRAPDACEPKLAPTTRPLGSLECLGYAIAVVMLRR